MAYWSIFHIYNRTITHIFFYLKKIWFWHIQMWNMLINYQLPIKTTFFNTFYSLEFSRKKPPYNNNDHNGIFKNARLALLPPGDPAGGGVERALPALRHPVVSAPGQLPAALSAGPLPRLAGEDQLHQPGPAPPAGGLQPLQGPRRRSHGVRLPQGRRALQTGWGHRRILRVWQHG